MSPRCIKSQLNLTSAVEVFGCTLTTRNRPMSAYVVPMADSTFGWYLNHLIHSYPLRGE